MRQGAGRRRGRQAGAVFVVTMGLLMAIGCNEGSSNPAEAQAPADSAVTFRVTVPEGTPDTASVWISGNHPALGDWSGRGLRARRLAGGAYEARQVFAPGSSLEFKVTRGGWETVEKAGDGSEMPNRRHLVDPPDTLDLVVANWRDWVKDDRRESTLTGDIRLHRGIASRFLTPVRDVIVYLPPGYASESDRRYPVLYMHDGQNIFDAATSFVGEWRVDETAEDLIGQGAIEPLIVVGVYNTADRISEYTPAVDAGRGGNADNYGRFLVDELKPFIDSTYRTLPDREHSGVAGSSLGGLVSMHFALTLSETFSRIGVVSPSVWWADQHILGEVRGSSKPASRIWLDMGTGEGAEAVAGARALRDALVAKGWVLGGDLAYVEAPGAAHNEAAWAQRVSPILRFLFPAP